MATKRKKKTTEESHEPTGSLTTDHWDRQLIGVNPVGDPIHLVYPRVALKKNSRDVRIVFSKKRKRNIAVPCQSKSYTLALKHSMPEILKQWGEREPIGGAHERLDITAIYYAGPGVEPDLDGACVGCGDLLAKAGVIYNDRFIHSWDGSRVIPHYVHQQEPHTEVTIVRREYIGPKRKR